jgi:fructose-1,6-bisphosphatase/inositol monophosphatase family enzyme
VSYEQHARARIFAPFYGPPVRANARIFANAAPEGGRAVTQAHPLLEPIRALHREIRAGVLAACAEQSLTGLAAVAEDGEGDTLYAIDKVSEALLVERLGRDAERLGGVVLVAEGIPGGVLTLPERRDAGQCRYRVIVDPIDGTRSLMYQKRPAWILTGVAENRGPDTRLSDVELAVQTELPLVKQYLADELWAVRGQGAGAERVDLLSSRVAPLRLAPSRAVSIEHGYAMISRLFVADLRPRLEPLLAERGLPPPLCCHPYDISTALIAEELGVCVRSPEGTPFDCRLDIDEDVAWVGYANAALRDAIEPVLVRALARRGWLLTA